MILFLIISATLFTIDIITKMLTDGKTTELVSNIISFRSTHNDGVAFSMFAGAGTILAIVSTLLIVASIVFYTRYKNKTTFLNIAFAFFISGAIGNLFDRIFYGYVRDFIALDFINFPIFNFADICLNLSIVLFAIYLIFIYKNPQPKEK